MKQENTREKSYILTEESMLKKPLRVCLLVLLALCLFMVSSSTSNRRPGADSPAVLPVDGSPGEVAPEAIAAHEYRMAGVSPSGASAMCDWEWLHCVWETYTTYQFPMPVANGLRDFIWQQWTAATPCTLKQVDLYMAGVKSGDPGLRIAIYDDMDGFPGTEIAYEEFSTASIPPGGFVSATFADFQPLIVMGTYYVFTSRASWAGDGDTLLVAMDDAPSCPLTPTCYTGFRSNTGNDLYVCDYYGPGNEFELFCEIFKCCVELPRISFYQMDYNLDGIATDNTDWGTADLSFLGSPDVMYFNLTVNGVWQVQNIPVLSIEGEGVEQTHSIPFDLGNEVGENVTSLEYAYSLTPDTLATGPVGATPAAVGCDTIQIYNCGKEQPFPLAPGAAEVVKGGEVQDAHHNHADFPNQLAGHYECAPAAVSNSLQFLNREHKLGLKPEDMTIAKWKEVLGFVANWGVSRDGWPALKDAYMKKHGIPITTRVFPAGDIDKIGAEIDAKQDVEMELFGHTVSVVGISRLKNGTYKFDIAHDRFQCDGKTPPKKPENNIWDPVTQSWSGTLTGFGLNYFVVECPKEPAPVPGKNSHSTDGYVPGMGSPVGSWWHELYPVYCEMWELTSWHDNGDGYLSVCDTVKFINPETFEVSWEHIAQVTPTMTITNIDYPGDDIYLDLLNYNPLIDPITDPEGLIWHEVYPEYCTKYQLEWWEDNGSGYLDYCDYIGLQVISGPDSGYVDVFHVEDVVTDIVTDTLCDCGTWGDVNDDDAINPLDIVYMVNFVYKNQDARIQPPYCPYEAGDVECGGQVNPVDVVYYVNYVYKGLTPWPCYPCE